MRLVDDARTRVGELGLRERELPALPVGFAVVATRRAKRWYIGRKTKFCEGRDFGILFRGSLVSACVSMLAD